MDCGRPLLLVVSAPSGAGKTTLCDRLLATYGNLVYSVSCTTRAPRGKERDGEDYHFLTREEFDDRVRRGEFLEYAEVHDNMYGTLRETVERAMEEGRSVLMDIDVQGAELIRNAVSRLPADAPPRRGFVDIFIAPPSLDALRERLEGRAEDAPEVIERRIRNARKEMEAADEYMYYVVNDELDRAYSELCGILEKEWQRHG